DERLLVERLQRGENRQTADQLGNQAELEDVVGIDLRKQLGQGGVAAAALGFGVPPKPAWAS
ncbi:MAG: hypothetical protein ACK6DO_13485, partial [Planctomycetia bacterium]